MKISVRNALLLSATALVAGCAAKWNGAEQAMTVAEQHPISVDSQTVTMTLSAGESFSEIDRARIRAFASSYMQNGHGSLTITSPDATEAASVKVALNESGVSPSAISEAGYRGGEGTSREVILSFTRYVATPSACGVWEGLQDRDSRNMRSPNFGCASQNNLAAMIGDPHDLVEPAAMTAPDSATRIRGVTKFRKGEITSSKTDGEVNQKVSDQ